MANTPLTGMARLMIRKPISLIQADAKRSELKRSLSAANLVSLGVGAIIGAGIFVITGQAAATAAGPALIISFLIAGLVCAFAGLCYAELASTLPVSGSAYTYAYGTMGEVVAWAMGWLLLLEYGVAASTVAVGWSGYVTSFMADFGLVLPTTLTESTMQFVAGEGLQVTPSINLVASLGILAVTALLVVGISESAKVNNVIVLVKVGVLLLFIGIGLFHMKPENWVPFIPPAGEKFGEFGISGIFVAASMVFFAYVGFEAVSTAAGEAKNPSKDLPVGILGSLAICTALYILTTLVLTGVVSYTQLNVKEPMAIAADAMGLPWFSFLIKVGAITGLSSVMLVLCYAQTRVFYQMARDGLLPTVFSKIHATLRTPANGTVLLGVIIAIAAATLPLGVLGDLVSLGTASAFLIVCLSVIFLRQRHPEIERPFQVPFYPLFPIIGVLLCLVMIVPLLVKKVTMAMAGDPVPLGLLVGYLVIGVIVYAAYGMKNSTLANGEAVLGDASEPLDPNEQTGR
jgi:basic amino acid/polyamine antiporter, APA family